ncbi:Aste57867_13134 [Aphanomyces stellatus]|uniref:Aste57867_13134 protein n=1 Tax=Aphanomyces stellatus TaxID=120398 RepID=A0A485KXD7_9STRA|nr:hypothetical protein As57867_013085 [Aphanomyces stellatus]VFT89976.1 Aste57867_13134 [Aphanomyces stellatus]
MFASITKQSRFVHFECQETLFQDSYKRNNKSSGNKHLRCFPHCCKAHNSTGYCGSTLLVETTIQHEDLMVFAKFDLEKEASLHVGAIVKVQVFHDDAHFISGRRVDGQNNHTSKQMYEINSKRNSWHYGWVSSRFVKSEVLHQMKVYLVMPMDTTGNVLCVDILTSKSFKIESTRSGTKQMAKLQQLAQQIKQPPPATIPPPPSMLIPTPPPRKRPHLVLEDPSSFSQPNKIPPRLPSPPPQDPTSWTSDIPTSFLPPQPIMPPQNNDALPMVSIEQLNLFNMAIPPRSASIPTQQHNVSQAGQIAMPSQYVFNPTQPMSQVAPVPQTLAYLVPNPIPPPVQAPKPFSFQQTQPEFEPPPLPFKLEYKAPPSFVYPAVNNFTNEIVLGNDDFLDSLISGMEDDDDDMTPRPYTYM